MNDSNKASASVAFTTNISGGTSNSVMKYGV